MQPSIEFKDVSKSYGTNTILNNFSLAIPENTTTALVGESGSGKSTLLQLTNGLISPDNGDVFVLGEVVADQNLIPLRLRTGYAVQGGGLFPHLTTMENVGLVARLQGWTEEQIRERASRLFEVLDLEEEFFDRFPHSLSGGQQQRVSLCRAMMLNPPLLLLDEPFSALDPMTRASIHVEFLRIREFENRTILLVTHDMQEAIKLAEYLVILRNGEVVQEGEPAEIRDQPASDYVAELLGTAQ